MLLYLYIKGSGTVKLHIFLVIVINTEQLSKLFFSNDSDRAFHHKQKLK